MDGEEGVYIATKAKITTDDDCNYEICHQEGMNMPIKTGHANKRKKKHADRKMTLGLAKVGG